MKKYRIQWIEDINYEDGYRVGQIIKGNPLRSVVTGENIYVVTKDGYCFWKMQLVEIK